MSGLKNLFEQVDFNKNSEEFIEILSRQNNFRIERIVSQGHVSPKIFGTIRTSSSGSLCCRVRRSSSLKIIKLI